MNSNIRSLAGIGLLVLALACCGCAGKKTDAKAKTPAAKSSTQAEVKKSDQPKSSNVPPVANGQLPTGNSLTDILSGRSTGSPLGLGANAPAKPAAGSLPVVPKPGSVTAVKPVPPVGRPQAKQLLMVVQAAYRSAKSVQADGYSSILVKQDGKVLLNEKNLKISTLYKAPSKFVLTSPDSKTSCDGKEIVDYSPVAKQYRKRAFKPEIVGELVHSRPGIGMMGLLFGVDYVDAIDRFKLLKDAKVSGHDTFVLSLHFKKGAGRMAGADINQTLWIGKNDLVIYKNQVVAKMKPEAPKGYKGNLPKLVETTQISTITKFTANAKVADSVFAFKAPSGAKAIVPPKPVNLIGKPAPDFAFTAADGAKKSVSDYKGKTVLLIFWGLPLPDGQLEALQSAYDTQKENAEIIAINFNDQDEKVKEHMQKKGYSVPVVFGNENIFRVAIEKYGIKKFPSFVIIDKSGMVRLATIGIPEGKDLDAKVQKYGL